MNVRIKSAIINAEVNNFLDEAVDNIIYFEVETDVEGIPSVAKFKRN